MTELATAGSRQCVGSPCPVCGLYTLDVVDHQNSQHPNSESPHEIVDRLPAVRTRPAVQKWSPTRASRSSGQSSLCPVCCKEFATQQFLNHCRKSHPGHRWTSSIATAYGWHLCGCGTPLANRTQAVTSHRTLTGCKMPMQPEGSSVTAETQPEHSSTASKKKSGFCPVCNKSFRVVLAHALMQHSSHHWTSHEASAIGGFACICGALLSNNRTGLRRHSLESGCKGRSVMSNQPQETTNMLPVASQQPEARLDSHNPNMNPSVIDLTSETPCSGRAIVAGCEAVTSSMSSSREQDQAQIKVSVVVLDGTRAVLPVFRTRTLRFVLTAVSVKKNIPLDHGVCVSIKQRCIENHDFDRTLHQLGIQDQDEIVLLPSMDFF